MRKKILTLMAVSLLTAVSASTAYAAGWDRDEIGYWYLFEDNAYARDQIIAIDGINYAFNKQAYMVTGWHNVNNDWYYFSPDTGAQVTGWLQLDGKWYYLNPENEGIMQTSWLNLGKKRYYFDANGVMQTGAFTTGGYYYFAEADGAIRRNTSETENGITIRYDEDGVEWYKNEENILNSKAGGDSWLPVLEERALMDQRMEVQESNEEFINSKKDELAERFKQDISKSRGDKSRDKKISQWKEKANRQLAKLSVSQQEIDAFIAAVVEARYGSDKGSWTYDYTETNADGSTTEWTYSYWYGNARDSDDEYDYDDYDDYDYYY